MTCSALIKGAMIYKTYKKFRSGKFDLIDAERIRMPRKNWEWGIRAAIEQKLLSDIAGILCNSTSYFR